ncbi:MAG: hypothetical protein WAL01_18670, partial [Pseudolabrys sp.]
VAIAVDRTAIAKHVGIKPRILQSSCDFIPGIIPDPSPMFVGNSAPCRHNALAGQLFLASRGSVQNPADNVPEHCTFGDVVRRNLKKAVSPRILRAFDGRCPYRSTSRWFPESES